MIQPHLSVLLDEILKFYQEKALSVFIDGTLGAGGHAESLLKLHPEIEHFIGIDQDPTALEIAKERLRPWSGKSRFFKGNFTDFETFLDDCGILEIDGMSVHLRLEEKE